MLYLYVFLENSGINIYKHSNIVANLRKLCGNCCSDTSYTNNKESDLVVTITASCSDSVLAEGFVLY